MCIIQIHFTDIQITAQDCPKNDVFIGDTDLFLLCDSFFLVVKENSTILPDKRIL